MILVYGQENNTVAKATWLEKVNRLSIRHQNGVIEGNLLFVWSAV